MIPIIYLNGRFVPADDAAVSVSDAAFLHGAGLFETIRAENRTAFRLDAHCRRLLNSAERLQIPVDPSTLPGIDQIADLLKRNELTNARVRLTVTAGTFRTPQPSVAPTPTICLSAAPLHDYPKALYEQGVGVILCDYRISPTDPLAGHKTTCYLPRLLGLRQAQAARCIEAIWFTTTNYLAEGCISNVFLVRTGGIATPPLDTPVLPGIARAETIVLARDAGLSIRETPLTINDLLDADEVFLTNSIMQVLPVIRVEKHDIGAGRVGPVAGALGNAYRQAVQKECGSR